MADAPLDDRVGRQTAFEDILNAVWEQEKEARMLDRIDYRLAHPDQ